MLKILIICANVLLINFPCQASNWNDLIGNIRIEAIESGINPVFFDKIFNNLTPNQKILKLNRNQPEKRITFLQYRESRIDPYRIHLGRKYFKKHKSLLKQIGKDFGVSPCIITAIWGLESSYGRYMGTFNVIRSLATLAYNSDRSSFFRKELMLALHILHQGHIEYNQYVGEWAGASGQSQFLPSSWVKFAIDYNNDGKKDVWKTHSDIFASIANYLKMHGWEPNQPWAIEATIPDIYIDDELGKDNIQNINYWRQLGVKSTNNVHLPLDTNAALLYLDGGPYFLIFKNFNVLMTYNRSNYYAGAVGFLANKICNKPN